MAKRSKTTDETPQNDNTTPETTEIIDKAANDYPSPVWQNLTPEERARTHYLKFYSPTGDGRVSKPLKFIDSEKKVSDSLTDWQNYDLAALGLLVGAGLCYIECRGDGKGVIRRFPVTLPGPDRNTLQTTIESRQTESIYTTGGITTLPIGTMGHVPVIEGMNERERLIFLLGQQQFYAFKQEMQAIQQQMERLNNARIDDVKGMLAQLVEFNRLHHDAENQTKTTLFSTVNAVTENAMRVLKKQNGKQVAKMLKTIASEQREETKEVRKKAEKLREENEKLAKKTDKKEKIMQWVMATKELIHEVPGALEAIQKFRANDAQSFELEAQRIAEKQFQEEQQQRQLQESKPLISNNNTNITNEPAMQKTNDSPSNNSVNTVQTQTQQTQIEETSSTSTTNNVGTTTVTTSP